jgi:hypothetical protein
MVLVDGLLVFYKDGIECTQKHLGICIYVTRKQSTRFVRINVVGDVELRGLYQNLASASRRTGTLWNTDWGRLRRGCALRMAPLLFNVRQSVSSVGGLWRFAIHSNATVWNRRDAARSKHARNVGERPDFRARPDRSSMRVGLMES